MWKRFAKVATPAMILLLSACGGGAVKPVTSGADATDNTAATEQVVDPAVERGFRKALQSLQQQDYAAAAEQLENLIQQAPNLPGLHLNLGIAYLQLKDHERAEAALQRTVDLAPDNVIAWNQLGILYRRLGRFNEALNAYQLALDSAPDYLPAHLNLGILCDLYLLQPQCALAHYTRYLELQGEAQQDVTIWIADLKQRYPELTQ